MESELVLNTVLKLWKKLNKEVTWFDWGFQTAKCQLSGESNEELKQGRYRIYFRVRGRKEMGNNCQVFYLNNWVDGKPVTQREVVGGNRNVPLLGGRGRSSLVHPWFIPQQSLNTWKMAIYLLSSFFLCSSVLFKPQYSRLTACFLLHSHQFQTLV